VHLTTFSEGNHFTHLFHISFDFGHYNVINLLYACSIKRYGKPPPPTQPHSPEELAHLNQIPLACKYKFVHIDTGVIIKMKNEDKGSKTDHFWNHIKKAGPSLSPSGIALADEKFLSMACYLSGSPRYHKVSSYSTPISFSQFL
jgi:hypothetical protein